MICIRMKRGGIHLLLSEIKVSKTPMTLSLVEGDSIHESLNGLLDRLVATFNEDEFYQLTQGLSMEEKSAFIQSYIFENLNEQGMRMNKKELAHILKLCRDLVDELVDMQAQEA